MVIYIDNILVTGSSEEAHLKALDEVLSWLDRGVKRGKCEFQRSLVPYLGDRVAADDLHLLPDWVHTIKDALTPESVIELKLYLRMLTYYSKFLPNLSMTLHPLYLLL